MNPVAMPEETMGRVYSGTSEAGAVEFSPNKKKMAAAAQQVRQVHIPRPSKHRYPTDPEVFAYLKGGARNTHIPSRDVATMFMDRAAPVAGMRLAAAARRAACGHCDRAEYFQ